MVWLCGSEWNTTWDVCATSSSPGTRYLVMGGGGWEKGGEWRFCVIVGLVNIISSSWQLLMTSRDCAHLFVCCRGEIGVLFSLRERFSLVLSKTLTVIGCFRIDSAVCVKYKAEQYSTNYALKFCYIKTWSLCLFVSVCLSVSRSPPLSLIVFKITASIWKYPFGFPRLFFGISCCYIIKRVSNWIVAYN